MRLCGSGLSLVALSNRMWWLVVCLEHAEDFMTRARRRWCTARPAGLRVTPRQRRGLLGLLVSAGDVWACVLELNRWRRQRQDAPLAGSRAVPGAGRRRPGLLRRAGQCRARSVLRRYSDAWFASAARRRGGDAAARFLRRRRAMVPVRWYHGTFSLHGRELRIPVAKGRPPLVVRLDRDLPYPRRADPVGHAEL